MGELRAIILPEHLHDWNALGQDDAEAFDPIAINGLLASGGREVVLRQVPSDTNAAPLLRDADAGRVYVIVEGDDE